MHDGLIGPQRLNPSIFTFHTLRLIENLKGQRMTDSLYLGASTKSPAFASMTHSLCSRFNLCLNHGIETFFKKLLLLLFIENTHKKFNTLFKLVKEN